MSDALKMQCYEEDEDPDGFYNSSVHDIARVLTQGDARGSSPGQLESEYVNDDNEMSSQPGAIDGGYVLPPQDRNNAFDVEQPTTRPHNKKKPSVSDIYDEDHYTLARNSGFGLNFANGSKHGKTKSGKKNRLLTSQNIIAISIICCVFAIGGVCAYILTIRLGIVICNCYAESDKSTIILFSSYCISKYI